MRRRRSPSSRASISPTSRRSPPPARCVRSWRCPPPSLPPAPFIPLPSSPSLSLCVRAGATARGDAHLRSRRRASQGRGGEGPPSPPSSPPHSPSPLILTLTLTLTPTKIEAAKALRSLSEHHPANQTAVAAADGIHPLVALIGGGSDEAQREAASALTAAALDHTANGKTTASPLVISLGSPNDLPMVSSCMQAR